MVKYSKKRKLQIKFIKELALELFKNKLNNINVDIIMYFIENISQYINDDKEDEYEINWYFVGMSNLFRQFIVKMWKGINFSSNKYKVLNKIVVRKHINFYLEY